EFCFRQAFRLAGEVTELGHNLRIDLVVSVYIERLGAVERNLQAARLIQRLDPNSRRQQLITSGMVWIEFDELIEVALRFVVIDVIERIKTAASQFVKPRPFGIR